MLSLPMVGLDFSNPTNTTTDIDPSTVLQYLSDELEENSSLSHFKQSSQESYSTPKFPSTTRVNIRPMCHPSTFSKKNDKIGSLPSEISLSRLDTKGFISVNSFSEIFAKTQRKVVPKPPLNLPIVASSLTRPNTTKSEDTEYAYRHSFRKHQIKKSKSVTFHDLQVQKRPWETTRKSQFGLQHKKSCDESKNNPLQIQDKPEQKEITPLISHEKEIDRFLEFQRVKSYECNKKLKKDEGRFTTFSISDLREFLRLSSEFADKETRLI